SVESVGWTLALHRTGAALLDFKFHGRRRETRGAGKLRHVRATVGPGVEGKRTEVCANAEPGTLRPSLYYLGHPHRRAAVAPSRRPRHGHRGHRADGHDAGPLVASPVGAEGRAGRAGADGGRGGRASPGRGPGAGRGVCGDSTPDGTTEVADSAI